ncbi:receptor-type tyrosine-protein phosphatase kappa-like isoform X7 [Lampetra fluviatilis]
MRCARATAANSPPPRHPRLAPASRCPLAPARWSRSLLPSSCPASTAATWLASVRSRRKGGEKPWRVGARRRAEAVEFRGVGEFASRFGLFKPRTMMAPRWIALALCVALTRTRGAAPGAGGCTIGVTFPACGFHQDPEDDFDWEEVPTHEMDSIPGLEAPAGPFVMLADAAGRPTSSKARLALPAMMENDTHCLDFSYQVVSKVGAIASGSLHAYVRVNGGALGGPIWTAPVPRSRGWVFAELAVSTFWPNTYQIVFEVTSSVQLSYVALADVHILNYPCNEVPHFLNLVNEEVNAGQNASIQCVLISRRQQLGTLWLQSQKGKDVMVASSHLQARRYTATYSFPTAAKDDSDKFRCVVHSTEGASVSNFASLIVREPPTPVAPPLLLRVGPTNLWVHLNANSIVGEGPIILKEVMWKQSAGTWAEVNRADSQTYKLWHLDPDTAYEIRVLLTRPGEGGTGLPGPPLITRTRCAEPKHGPLNLRVVSIRSREISLQWEPLGYNVTRCHAFNVTVCYRSWATRGPAGNGTVGGAAAAAAEAGGGGEECRDAGRAAHGFVLPGLPPFRNLSLQAVLMTPEGRKASERVVTHTDEDVPGPVSLERVQGVVTEETIFLQWSEPDEPNGAIVQYEVLYSAVRSVDPAFNVEDEHGQAHKPANETQHLFPALYPGTTYSFSIRASTVKGLGPSATVYFTTKISAPTLPHYGADSLIDYTDTTATILLKPAQARGAPISAYQLVVKEGPSGKARREAGGCFSTPLAYREARAQGSPFYFAAELPPEGLPVERRFVVGDNHTYGGYWNAPLAASKVYDIFFQAISSTQEETKIACVKLAKRAAVVLSQLTTTHITTAHRGGGEDHETVTRNADLPDAELQTDHTMKIAGVIAGILAVLIILLGIVVYMKRRRSSHSYSYYLKLAKKRKETVSATRQEMTHMVNSMDRGYGDQSLTLIDDQGTFLDTHNVSTQSYYTSPSTTIQTHGTSCRTAQPYFIQDDSHAGLSDSGILLDPGSHSLPPSVTSSAHTLPHAARAGRHAPGLESAYQTGSRGKEPAYRGPQVSGEASYRAGAAPGDAAYHAGGRGPDPAVYRAPPPPANDAAYRSGQAANEAAYRAGGQQQGPEGSYHAGGRAKDAGYRLGPAPVPAGELMYPPAQMRTAIRVADLLQHMNQMKTTEGCGFKEEYESFLDGQSAPWQVAKKEENRGKNRYGNIIAYDHSRVLLQPLDANPHSDYINANFIDGYHRPRQYIATQGPMQETVYDFWRMVWQEKSASIVMVTNLVEVGRVKCYKYWPEDEQVHGDLTVSLVHTELLAEYVIRTFTVERTGYFEVQEVKQFHFTGWPDHGVPYYATGLLAFIRRVRSLNPPEAGPVVVHCSAGAGRTGCFIVIDMMLEMAEGEAVVDIYNCVRELRAQRVNMVQTEEQYVFIHDVILEACLCGDTAVPAAEFRSVYYDLARLDPQTHTNQIKEEFLTLNTVTPALRVEDCSIALLPRNNTKNRHKETLPPDRCLPFLLTLDGDSSNYINAALMDSYHRPSAFIVTQHPLPNTVKDFWRLVFDYRCTSVIVLNELNASETFPQYWPEEGMLQYGPVQVEILSACKDVDIISRIFRICNVSRPQDGHREVQHFQYLGWPSHRDVPTSPASFLRLVGRVGAWQDQLAEEEGRTLVHCLNGGGQSGTYCAVSILCDMVKGQSVADVFTAVKTLRNNKPNMVETLEQYRFCYDTALEFLSQFQP